MATRHSHDPSDWHSVMRRLEELVLAHSGDDAFEEVFKLLVAKLVAERDVTGRRPATSSQDSGNPVDRVNGLLRRSLTLFPGLVEEGDTTSLPQPAVTACLEVLDQVDLSASALEGLDAFFEHLVSPVSKGNKGQYFTPRHVVEACVRIVNPKAGELVADPACGSGAFLLHAHAHVARSQPEADYSLSLWGADLDSRALKVARAMLIACRADSAALYRLDSLRRSPRQRSAFDGQLGDFSLTVEDVLRSTRKSGSPFDAILTNPPFAGEATGPGIDDCYDLAGASRRVERDALFLERCVELLRPGGRIGIVLPHNKVGSKSWQYLREWLVRHVQVVGVMGLGRNTFQPHTSQKASVLFGLKRRRPGNGQGREPILFMVSERDGKDSRGRPVPSAGNEARPDAWSRLDHDLSPLVQGFQEHVRSNNIAWDS